MSRLTGITFVLIVVLLAMAFAAGNADHRATLNLGLFTLYRVPVTLVAFSGLMVGMVVMFATGVHSDIKVRRILRERLAEEAREEQKWIDRNQRDLFAQDPEPPIAAALGAGGPFHGESDEPVEEESAGLESIETIEPTETVPPAPSAFEASDESEVQPLEAGPEPDPMGPVPAEEAEEEPKTE